MHNTHHRSTKYVLLGFLLFAAVFLAARLPQLTLLPPYVDEGLHISRAFNVLEEQRLFVYTEGGKYLQIWLIAPVVGLGSDPLWNARAVSVLLGLLSAVGCTLLGRALFNRATVGLAAAIFYLVIPYAFFLDRLALNDSMLGTLAVFITLASLWWAKRQDIWSSLALGILLGLTGLTKLNGLILWLMPLLTLLIWSDKSTKSWLTHFTHRWRQIGLVYAIGLLLIAPLFWAIPAHLDGPATKTWLLDASPLGSMVELWLGNVERVWRYHQIYLTWPILLLAMLGAGLTLFRRHRGGTLLLSLILIYNLVFIITTVYIQSRYVFAVVPLSLILAGYGLDSIVTQVLRFINRNPNRSPSPTPYPLPPYPLLPTPYFLLPTPYFLLPDLRPPHHHPLPPRPPLQPPPPHRPYAGPLRGL